MMKFPELQKEVRSFLLDETGRITTEQAIKKGAVLSAAGMAMASNAAADHYSCNAKGDSCPEDFPPGYTIAVPDHTSTSTEWLRASGAGPYVDDPQDARSAQAFTSVHLDSMMMAEACTDSTTLSEHCNHLLHQNEINMDKVGANEIRATHTHNIVPEERGVTAHASCVC
ncbi:hypothetical protein KY359_04880 [Candidatus Woesearchaeota archaeon]|nr:hypothetical protein [Candidatus Woesearchaeota archaeon]